MPFRCLYSKDVKNLMMAGRCISVSHVALGATRVMITCGLQGQAVGTAAAICKLRGTTPRGLLQSHVGELQQQLLKDGCYLIDLPNRDPRDLALSAKAVASSTAPPESLKAPRLVVHPLNCARAVMFQVAGPRIEKVALHLVSESDQPIEVKLGLRAAKSLGDFSAAADLATAVATVPPQRRGWVEFLLDAEVKPGFYYVWLAPAKQLGWSLFDRAPPETARAYRAAGQWQRMSECYTFQLTPGPEAPAGEVAKTPPRETMFVASNVHNGFARAIRGWPNAWRPDPKEPLPQWVELDFGRPVAFDTVHVTFQTKADRAVDFRLEAAERDRWRTLIAVTGNEDRRRVIGFERTSTPKLRLVVEKTAGDMGVCEIRVYDERDAGPGTGLPQGAPKNRSR